MIVCLTRKLDLDNYTTLRQGTFTEVFDKRQGTFTEVFDERQGTFTEVFDERQGTLNIKL